MTEALVITHANGFFAAFTRDKDGSMRQRALIDTGEQPPTPEQLATMGAALADQWGWQAPTLPARNGKPKALPAGKVKVEAPLTKKAQKAANARARNLTTYGGKVAHADDPPPPQRPDMVVAYLKLTPYQTQREVLEGIGLEATHARLSRWHHTFARLLADGVLTNRQREGTKQRQQEWFLA